MTAEIAIINRSSITLAADSAMTLSVRGKRKIYTSTDKIFELSEKDPIGLMIYNNLEFMGAPLDVLIKQFRSSGRCCHVKSMGDSSYAFFEYLSVDWKPSVELQKRHAVQILFPVYDEVRRRFNTKVQELLNSQKDTAGKEIFLTLLNLMEETVDKYDKFPVAECFINTSEGEITEFYQDVLDGVIKKAFKSPPLNAVQKNLFRRLGTLALHREVFSELLTGFVFAGYGNDEVFPSLMSFHTDGIIANRLKTKKLDEVKTGRERISARIIPFAQREVVDRFLVGIDPDLESGVKNYFNTASRKTRENLFDGLKVSAKDRKRLLSNLDASLGVAVKDFIDTWMPTTRTAYAKQTEDMVLFMAKQEASHLAEALVNITSLKRKFSSDEENVAGPVDVAVISRNEGFVWVKRKHYFPAELNQRYVARRFGSVPTQKGDDHAEE